MAPASLFNFGNFPYLNIVKSTADVLMDSHSRAGSREEELYKGAVSKAVERALYSNPILELDFGGHVAAWSGFAVKHPGTHSLLADIPGWPTGVGANIFGFEGDTGAFVFVDPKSDGTRDGKMTQLSFKFRHFPFMGSSEGTSSTPT